MPRGGTQDVVLIGPEASGKTTLAAALSAHLGAPWVPEAARQFAETSPTPLSVATVAPIAHLAIALDDDARRHAPPLLIHDTDLISTVVYARHYYGACPAWIEAEARARRADLYLLCRPDLPWEADGVRDQPLAREALFGAFRDELQRVGATMAVIGGLGSAREEAALAAISALASPPRPHQAASQTPQCCAPRGSTSPH
jgi:nicotinamide riboside kinase